VKPEEEKAVVAKAKAGDAAAFEKLVTEYERLVYSVAYRLLGNEHDAQDAAQETFVKAYLSLDSFRGESKFSVWLYRTANNVCIDMLRKKTVPTVSLSVSDEDGEDAELSLPDERFSPETELEKKELRWAVNRAMAKLPEKYAQVLTLRHVAGQSYEEISETLNLDIGTVKSRIFRGRKKLCAILSEDGNFFDAQSSKHGKGGAKA
jgi:RNA polymerase sigma-70 factor (ECF subfamily)